MRPASFLTFLIPLAIPAAPIHAAESVTDADFARLEEEYAAAKQAFADEVKDQKRELPPSELRELRERLVGPKKRALDEAYSRRANARRIDPKAVGAGTPKENPLTGGLPADAGAPADPGPALPAGDIPAEIRYGKKDARARPEPTPGETAAADEPAKPEELGAGVSEIRYPKAKRPSPGPSP